MSTNSVTRAFRFRTTHTSLWFVGRWSDTRCGRAWCSGPRIDAGALSGAGFHRPNLSRNCCQPGPYRAGRTGWSGSTTADRRRVGRGPAMCSAWPTMRGRGMGGIDRVQTRMGIHRVSAWPSESPTWARRTQQRGLTPLNSRVAVRESDLGPKNTTKRPDPFELSCCNRNTIC
jgi:hypothetical protein